jgi:predicted ArsR family transcriptional regulator
MQTADAAAAPPPPWRPVNELVAALTLGASAQVLLEQPLDPLPPEERLLYFAFLGDNVSSAVSDQLVAARARHEQLRKSGELMAACQLEQRYWLAFDRTLVEQLLSHERGAAAAHNYLLSFEPFVRARADDLGHRAGTDLVFKRARLAMQLLHVGQLQQQQRASIGGPMSNPATASINAEQLLAKLAPQLRQLIFASDLLRRHYGFEPRGSRRLTALVQHAQAAFLEPDVATPRAVVATAAERGELLRHAREALDLLSSYLPPPLPLHSAHQSLVRASSLSAIPPLPLLPPQLKQAASAVASSQAQASSTSSSSACSASHHHPIRPAPTPVNLDALASGAADLLSIAAAAAQARPTTTTPVAVPAASPVVKAVTPKPKPPASTAAAPPAAAAPATASKKESHNQSGESESDDGSAAASCSRTQRIMQFLARHGATTVSDLASRLHVTKQDVYNSIANPVRNGLMDQANEPVAQDPSRRGGTRARPYKLTTAGRQAVGATAEPVTSSASSLLLKRWQSQSSSSSDESSSSGSNDSSSSSSDSDNNYSEGEEEDEEDNDDEENDEDDKDDEPFQDPEANAASVGRARGAAGGGAAAAAAAPLSLPLRRSRSTIAAIAAIKREPVVPSAELKSHPTRERIIRLLFPRGGMTVREMRQHLGMNYNTIHCHLRELVQQQVLTARKLDASRISFELAEHICAELKLEGDGAGVSNKGAPKAQASAASAAETKSLKRSHKRRASNEPPASPSDSDDSATSDGDTHQRRHHRLRRPNSSSDGRNKRPRADRSSSNSSSGSSSSSASSESEASSKRRQQKRSLLTPQSKQSASKPRWRFDRLDRLDTDRWRLPLLRPLPACSCPANE